MFNHKRILFVFFILFSVVWMIQGGEQYKKQYRKNHQEQRVSSSLLESAKKRFKSASSGVIKRVAFGTAAALTAVSIASPFVFAPFVLRSRDLQHKINISQVAISTIQREIKGDIREKSMQNARLLIQLRKVKQIPESVTRHELKPLLSAPKPSEVLMHERHVLSENLASLNERFLSNKRGELNAVRKMLRLTVAPPAWYTLISGVTSFGKGLLLKDGADSIESNVIRGAAAGAVIGLSYVAYVHYLQLRL